MIEQYRLIDGKEILAVPLPDKAIIRITAPGTYGSFEVVNRMDLLVNGGEEACGRVSRMLQDGRTLTNERVRFRRAEIDQLRRVNLTDPSGKPIDETRFRWKAT